VDVVPSASKNVNTLFLDDAHDPERLPAAFVPGE